MTIQAAKRKKPAKSGQQRRVTRLMPEERWSQICVEATRLFYEKGFNGTSMQDISDAVGVLKGSLYHYIDSKEDLLFHVLKSLHEEGLEVVNQIEFDTDDPLSELERYLSAMVVYAGVTADRLSIFFRDFQALTPEQQKAIISDRDIYVRVAQRLIKEAIDKEMVPPELDSKVAALSILSTTTATREWYRAGGGLTLDQIARQTASLMVNGLAHVGRKRPKRRARPTVAVVPAIDSTPKKRAV